MTYTDKKTLTICVGGVAVAGWNHELIALILLLVVIACWTWLPESTPNPEGNQK
jgi:hypothetical protein